MRREELKITIPAGIDDGQSIRMAGTDEPGTNGGERGDLLAKAVVSEHPVSIRRDMSIHPVVPVSFVTVALGGPTRVNIADGQVEYEMKSGTQTDTKVRLKGKGVPSLHNEAVCGDHHATLVVQVSERMNEEQREVPRQFDEVMTGKITRSGKGEGKESGNHKKKGFLR